MSELQIFKCSVGFRYTSYYVKVILTAKDKTDAKNKFIKKCLENFDKLSHIDFSQGYEEYNTEPPLKFNNIQDYEKWLIDNVNEEDDDDIECLGDCSFELCDAYE